MLKILGAIGGLAILIMILIGTWPIIFGKDPVNPLINLSQLEEFKDQVADEIKRFSLD